LVYVAGGPSRTHRNGGSWRTSPRARSRR
jgi:hypothetical protein